MKHNDALFGVYAYGSTITGSIVYGTPGDAADKFKGCTAFDPKVTATWPRSPIVMIDRGDCAFKLKALMAQQAGAIAVIIADNQKMCGEDSSCDSCGNTCRVNWNNNGCACNLPFMSDGGTIANDVDIPSYIISKVNAQKIKNMLATAEPVVAELSWDLPNPDDRVEWELWTSSWDGKGADTALKVDMQTISQGFGDRVQFTPHYWIYNGTEWGCNTPEQRCGSQCLYNGLYCAADPNHDLDTGLSGADVVEENLRQMCIWQVLSGEKADPTGEKYWKYVNLFNTVCTKVTDNVEKKDTTDQLKMDLECSNEQQLAVGIDSDAVTKCVAESENPDPKIGNTLLYNEILLREDISILTLPTATVNGVVLRGGPYSNVVMSAICSGFASGSEPPLCQCKGLDMNGIKSCVNNINAGVDPIPSVPAGSVVLTPLAITILVLVFVGMIGGGSYYFVGYLRKQTDIQVHKTLSNYRPLDDMEDVKRSSLF
jgi:hypothetical protein